jgi:hypothetical protein
MKRLWLVAALAVVVLALPAAARADTAITADCTVAGTTAPCSDSTWYTGNVHVRFNTPAGNNPHGCEDQDITSDTAGSTFTCTIVVGSGQCCILSVTIKRDATPPTVTGLTPARGPDANSWYNHAVDVAAAGTDAMSGIASCTTTTYSGPDASSASVTGTCTDKAGNVSAAKTIGFAYDATPPTISASAGRAADANGWYNHAVGVTFSGADALSGLDSCTSGTYSGPDNGSAAVAGTCRDKAGNTAAGSFGLRYDATAPAVTGATADRPPDLDGWYNHAVVVTFAGSDAASGVSSCATPTYSGPNDPTATVTGTCHDNAGNVSAAGSFALKFDSTPPTVTGLAVAAVDKSVSLTWKASADVASMKITRTGGGATAPVTVYNGKRTDRFTDKRVKSGDRYTYVITAFDPAGNPASAKVAATASAPLLSPRQQSTVHGTATLRWHAVPKATYYNVQLWLRGKKVLTTWPAGATYRLPPRWTYLGADYRLVPGRYLWYVWPGLGSRSQHRYGALIGKSTFVLAP